MSYRKRINLLQWANEGSGFMIEDDYDEEFRYNEQSIPSLQGLDRHHRMVYIGTFSKSLTPALRVNYMVLPYSLLSRMRRVYRKKHEVLVQAVRAKFGTSAVLSDHGAELHVALTL